MHQRHLLHSRTQFFKSGVFLMGLLLLLVAFSLLPSHNDGRNFSGVVWEKEEWRHHITYLETASGNKHPIEGAILDMGSKQHNADNSSKYPLYGRVKMTLNVHYAGKPTEDFEPAVMVDDDPAFELMRQHRETMEWKRAGKSQGPLEYYRHFGAICPQVINQWQADEYAEQKIPVEELEVTMADGAKVTRPAIMEDEDEDNPLNLNIFAPMENKLHRVLVFVHGGAYVQGSAPKLGIHGIVTQFVEQGKVLVVTINYRLGPFGFLSREELNLGIGDALTALRWVKKYIRFFGGDPNHITLAGESAGASTVGRLALELFRQQSINNGSQLQQQLVQQFVLISGSSRLMERDSMWGVRDIRDVFFKELYRLEDMPHHDGILQSELLTVAKNVAQRDPKQILKATIAAGIEWWDIEFHHPHQGDDSSSGHASATQQLPQQQEPEKEKKPQWFDTVARELIAEQSVEHHEPARILFLVAKDEAASFYEFGWRALPQLPNHPDQKILPRLSTSYAYYVFRKCLQSHMAKYGYHWVEQEAGAVKPAESTQEHQPRSHQPRLFRPAEWFIRARQEYEDDLEETLANYKAEFNRQPRKHTFSEFKRYYIDVQILSDLIFVLATAKDAIALAKHNHVFLMRMNIGKRQPESYSFPDDVIPHGQCNRMVFMPPDFFEDEDIDVNRGNAEKALKLGRELVAFIRGDTQRFSNDEHALKPDSKALPFLEVGNGETGDWRENGYMSGKRLAFWEELFGGAEDGGGGGFHESPFTDSNGVPIDFDKRKREAVLKAVGVSVNKLEGTVNGFMGEFPSELPEGVQWTLPTLGGKTPKDGEDVLKLVEDPPL